MHDDISKLMDAAGYKGNTWESLSACRGGTMTPAQAEMLDELWKQVDRFKNQGGSACRSEPQ